MKERPTARPEGPSPEQLARLAGQRVVEKKGTDVLILDLRTFSVGCDFFVIGSGASELHVRALADAVVEELAQRAGERPWHVEGRAHARWILLDYVDCVVHLFHRETREFYLLERLWGDAPTERLGEQDPSAAEEDDEP